MFEPRAVPGILLALGIAATAWPASAASQEPTEAELIARIEALIPAYETAQVARREARLRAEEASEPPPVRIDTVQVGPIRIVSLPDEAETARDLFAEVWRERFPMADESPRLTGKIFTFQWRTRASGLRLEPRADEEVIQVALSRVWAPTRNQAKAVVADAVARALVSDFPPGSPMSDWMTYRGTPVGESVYRILATGGSGAGRSCLGGDIDACEASLGFGFADSGARLAEWFSERERQDMVNRAAVGRRVDTDSAPYRRCLEENDVSGCDAILAELDWVTWPSASDRQRAHLLWYAAELGGPGAWRRALDRGEASIPEVLEALAGRPIDDLVADWQSSIVAQRPDVQAGLGGKGSRALFWSLFFAALAMRSTRWRLG